MEAKYNTPCHAIVLEKAVLDGDGNSMRGTVCEHYAIHDTGRNAILTTFRATRCTFSMTTCSMVTAQHGITPRYKDTHLCGTMPGHHCLPFS